MALVVAVLLFVMLAAATVRKDSSVPTAQVYDSGAAEPSVSDTDAARLVISECIKFYNDAAQQVGQYNACPDDMIKLQANMALKNLRAVVERARDCVEQCKNSKKITEEDN